MAQILPTISSSKFPSIPWRCLCCACVVGLHQTCCNRMRFTVFMVSVRLDALGVFFHQQLIFFVECAADVTSKIPLLTSLIVCHHNLKRYLLWKRSNTATGKWCSSQYWPSIQFNPSWEWLVLCLPTSLMSFSFPGKEQCVYLQQRHRQGPPCHQPASKSWTP